MVGKKNTNYCNIIKLLYLCKNVIIYEKNNGIVSGANSC